MTGETQFEKDVGKHNINNSYMEARESNPSHEHVLTPDTPTGGFAISGMGAPQDHVKTAPTIYKNGISQDCRFNVSMRCWTEILNAMDKVKANARLWQTQTDRLESKVGILDAVTHNILSEKTAVEDKFQELSSDLATLRLDKEAREGECHLLRETVVSLKRDLASEEQTRRRLEHLYESKEMEWSSTKARMQMEVDLSKGVLAMQKEAELQQRDTHEHAVESLRRIIEKKDEKIQNVLNSVDSMKSTAASVKHDMQVARLEADKYKAELDDSQRKSVQMAEQLEKDKKLYEEDMKRSQEIFESHKDAHQACLRMKDIEISSLKELGQSLQREYGSKICHLEAQITELKDSVSYWKGEHESIGKKYEEQCASLIEVHTQNASLKAKIDAITDTVKTLKDSESAYNISLKDLEGTLCEERAHFQAMEKKMQQELDQENVEKKTLQASKALLESQLTESSGKHETLQKSYKSLQERYDTIMKEKESPTAQNAATLPAVRPAAKRALQKRMKVSQKK